MKRRCSNCGRNREHVARSFCRRCYETWWHRVRRARMKLLETPDEAMARRLRARLKYRARRAGEVET